MKEERREKIEGELTFWYERRKEREEYERGKEREDGGGTGVLI